MKLAGNVVQKQCNHTHFSRLFADSTDLSKKSISLLIFWYEFETSELNIESTL